MKKLLFIFACIVSDFALKAMEENIPMEELSKKRKTPQKKLAQQPSKKRRRLQRICPSTLREISKQTFIESIPEIENLPQALLSLTVPEEVTGEIKKELEELPFEQTQLHQAESALEVENLLTLGVDPNKKDHVGRTALNALIDYGYLDAAFHLVELRMVKLDVNTPDQYGFTPLQRASEHQDAKLVDLILKILKEQKDTVSINYYNSAGESAFTLAIRSMPELVDTLITLGAEVNKANGAGRTPLMVAAMFSPSVIETLIKHGANLYAVNKKGDSAVTYAIEKNNLKAVQLLLDAGAKITQKDLLMAKNKSAVLKIITRTRYAKQIHYY